MWDWSLVHPVPMEIEVTAALFKAERVDLDSDADPATVEALFEVPLVR